jgi:8-oxo-dGTP pyrophosphatase MutT (NUDIX family)
MKHCAHAILTQGPRYVLQLRDKKPDISASGQWSLFGGTVAPGESPYATIRREIFEELSLRPRRFDYLWTQVFWGEFERAPVRLWLFEANVDDCWHAHELHEGRRAQVFHLRQTHRLAIPTVMRDALKIHYGARTAGPGPLLSIGGNR